MSTHILATGIFASEAGQRFLHILMKMADVAIRPLYTKSNGIADSQYYQQGLRRVHTWSDECVQEDIRRVQSECPDLEDTMETCFVCFVRDRFSGARRPTTCNPSYVEFTRRYYESLSLHDHMVAGTFFTDSLSKRITCMECAR